MRSLLFTFQRHSIFNVLRQLLGAENESCKGITIRSRRRRSRRSRSRRRSRRSRGHLVALGPQLVALGPQLVAKSPNERQRQSSLFLYFLLLCNSYSFVVHGVHISFCGCH